MALGQCEQLQANAGVQVGLRKQIPRQVSLHDPEFKVLFFIVYITAYLDLRRI